jgi:hypothetical protein
VPTKRPLCGDCGHGYAQHQDDDGTAVCWGGTFSNCGCLQYRPPTEPAIDRPLARVGGRHPATARLAAARALPRTGSLRRTLYDALRLSRHGMTDDEMEFFLARPHQTVSSLRNGLMNDGWVVDSGLRRQTRYGNDAIVWTCVLADGRTQTISAKKEE